MLTYHKARDGSTEALLDLGCGHGLVSRALAPHFSSATAIDPSPGMVAQARQLTNASANISIRQASAEDLSFLPAGSVDLAVAGEAAHWFDYTRAWPALARVVRKGGSLAFWGYNDSLVVGYAQLRPIYLRYCYGTGDARPGLEAMGRYWEDPGRTVLRNSFAAIEPPEADWADVQRVVFEPDSSATYGVERAPQEALWLRKRLQLGEYMVYLRTMSAVHNWRSAHPERRSRAEGGEGDVVDAMVEEMVDAVPEWRARGHGWAEVEVEVIWGTCLLMARRT